MENLMTTTDEVREADVLAAAEILMGSALMRMNEDAQPALEPPAQQLRASSPTRMMSDDEAALEAAAEASAQNMKKVLEELQASPIPLHAKMTTLATMAKAHFAKFYSKDTMGGYDVREIQLQIVDQCLFFLSQPTFRAAMLCARCGAGKTVMASLILRCLAAEAFHNGRHVFKVLLTHPKSVGASWNETVRKVFTDYPNIEVHTFDIGTNWISADANLKNRDKFFREIRMTAMKTHEPLAEGECERALRGTVIIFQVSESFTKHERATQVLRVIRQYDLQWDITVMDESADALRGDGSSDITKFARDARTGAPFLAISATPEVRSKMDAMAVLFNLIHKDFSKCNPKEVSQLFDAFAVRDKTTPPRDQRNRLRLYVVKVPLTSEQKEVMAKHSHAGTLRTIQVAQVIPPNGEVTKAERTKRLRAAEDNFNLPKSTLRSTFIVTEVFVHIYNALVAIRALNKGPAMVVLERLSAIEGFKQGLETALFRVGVIIGDVPQHERDEIIQKLRDGRLDVLLIQAQLGLGIDLDMCLWCLVTSPDWLDTRMEQTLHRMRRYAKAETDHDGRTAIIYATDGPHARYQFDVMWSRFADKNDRTPVQWPEQLVSPETHMALVLAENHHFSAPDALTDLSYNHEGADLTPLTPELRDEILRDAEEKAPGCTRQHDLEFLRMQLWGQRPDTTML